jgi:phage terminase large subunit GpA-like protein
MTEGMSEVLRSSLNLLKPPPSLTVSAWADKFRVLSPEGSSEAGKFETSRAVFQKEIMDVCADPSVQEVVVMSCSQVGKTETLLNTIGYYIAYEPAPILMVQPTLEMARSWSQDRLSTMVRDTPIITNKVADAKSRDAGNTTLHKTFEGGHITACGANSPASLASRPIKIVMCDEVDRYPSTAGSEGDPVLLAKRRSATFWDSKLIMTSTPTVSGASRIERAYENSDQRKFYVPCIHCKYSHIFEWKNVIFDKEYLHNAHLVCPKCKGKIDNADRIRSIAKGVWKASEKFTGIAGFHLSGLYSPWISLEEAAKEFLSAKKMPETLRVFVNTYLGESWEDEGERIDDLGLFKRKEEYTVPDEVVLITAGVDIQDDRIEMEVVGWGLDEESWSLDYLRIYGDPSAPNIWNELDTHLSKTYNDMRIISCCIDSGHHTNQVYKFCKPRLARRIFAIKGQAGDAKTIVGRSSRNNIMRCPLFPVGVDTAKELIYSRLNIQNAGAGYCHFPMKYDEEYFKQLTAEKIVTKYRRGFKRREWVLTRSRNEALDCRVYALASLTVLNADLKMLAKQKAQTKKNPSRLRDRNKKGNFVSSWKN